MTSDAGSSLSSWSTQASPSAALHSRAARPNGSTFSRRKPKQGAELGHLPDLGNLRDLVRFSEWKAAPALSILRERRWKRDGTISSRMCEPRLSRACSQAKIATRALRRQRKLPGISAWPGFGPLDLGFLFGPLRKRAGCSQKIRDSW